MANEYAFTTANGQPVKRELLLAYLNTGTADAPVWSVIGKRVTDSSMEFDWAEEGAIDILGNNNVSLSKPTITQTFDPCPLEAGDAAQKLIWDTAIVQQDYVALASMEMLIVHTYANFAETYSACRVTPSSLGGAGGASVGMPIDVTYGGIRTVGSATTEDGVVTFVPKNESI